ncbi:MAG: thiolase family protein [Cycloclasticus sp.]
MMKNAVIIEAVRTPFGKFNGAFRETPANKLLANALQGVVDKSGIDKAKIDDVVAGSVTQIGEQAADIARQSLLMAGFPIEVAGVTLNRFCGSGQQAVHFASQVIDAGDSDYMIASGVESMTRVGMLTDMTVGGPYKGFEPMGAELLNKYPLVHQGVSAELLADKWGITREEVDAFAVDSHAKAQAAIQSGANKEIMSMPGLDKEGNAITLNVDEGVRAVIDPIKLASLDTIFRPEGGVVTAGNASQISDGAAAVLIANKQVAIADGFTPRAQFRARVVIGSDPVLQLDGPIAATKLALKKAGLTVDDIDWFEINEAFATVSLAWMKEINPKPERVNPWGGAIAHGHPLGATGAGLTAKMVAGLEATGGQFALQTMCIGLGMATATIIERI